MDDAITIAEPTTLVQARIADFDDGASPEITDVHLSKIPPGDPRLSLARKRSRTLRAGPAIAAAIALVAVIAISIVVAFSASGSRAEEAKKNVEPEEAASATPLPLPDVIRDPPQQPALRPAESPAMAGQYAQTQREPTPRQRRAEAFGQVRQEELLKARAASVFAAVDDVPPELSTRAAPPATTTSTADPNARTPPPSSNDPNRAAADPNLQERKNDFLARAGVSTADYSDKMLVPPKSPYELKAGTIIPAVLITGINSDLPGQVLGQVRENVYDTVSGNYLLIPQGSRLVAAYDSMVAWGQQRVLVCWNRLIRPDGTSIQLDCMPGVDLAGYSGFADEVDNHWWKIISGAAFASLLAATAQRSQGDVTGFQPSFPQVWASNAAGSINQAGQQLTQKNMQIQPTITVRPGFSINVFVSRDLILSPYRPEGAAP